MHERPGRRRCLLFLPSDKPFYVVLGKLDSAEYLKEITGRHYLHVYHVLESIFLSEKILIGSNQDLAACICMS